MTNLGEYKTPQLLRITVFTQDDLPVTSGHIWKETDNNNRLKHVYLIKSDMERNKKSTKA
jgi:hypothetical protein